MDDGHRFVWGSEVYEEGGGQGGGWGSDWAGGLGQVGVGGQVGGGGGGGDPGTGGGAAHQGV